ncbi:BON domain-containing protein [Rheinheimera salexigens]|uniref:BON domain-containing protein n=1 Tax=Rheinheimera salexigens TaxID=1628148 RepID=A0A1E7Q649_9GAMM|nr:BON domain-containing protein [Rheinheimera salexigens]OEY69627.1 hypothetical protein BI198_08700 [Rheinheimera salexigens]
MFIFPKTIVIAAVLAVLSLGLTSCDKNYMDDETKMLDKRVVLEDGVADDVEVSNAVIKALHDESKLSQFMINVETRKGDVTLRGDVDTEEQRKLAEQVTLSTAGAHTVNNEIRVRQ